MRVSNISSTTHDSVGNGMFRDSKDTTQLEPAHEVDLRFVAFMVTVLIHFKHRWRFFTDVEPGYNPDAIVSNTFISYKI
jgi:hypothetical protein